MSARMNFKKASPGAYQAMRALENHLHQSGLQAPLLELIKTRVSQMNGCAYCLDMHTKDARAAGESEQRLYLLPAWRETSFYSSRERAALAWAEAVTHLGPHGVSDAVYEEARAQFDEKGLADLTLAVIAINGWNRLAVPFRSEAGLYQPPPRKQA